MATGGGQTALQTMSAVQPRPLFELSVSCKDLTDVFDDVFSKCHPMCVLYEEFGQQNWSEYGRTEIMWNNLNPEFAKKFFMTFHFEETQRLKFAIYDIDSESPDLLSLADFLGAVETTLEEIIAMDTLTIPLRRHGVPHGTITVTAEELLNCKEEITLQFMGLHLEKKSSFLFFDMTEPFLSLSKGNENGTFTIVHRTEHLQSCNPMWKQFTLSVQSLCNGDYDRMIKIQCNHYKADGDHKLIGEAFFTLNQLTDPDSLNSGFELINAKKQSKNSKYKNSGQMVLQTCIKTPIYTFLDYISGGTELVCTIAIDFTASNGDPRNPTSLHNINWNQPNHYEQALRAVGEIIQDYDSDKRFPVLGFGARLPPDGKVSHEFFVTMDPSNPYCAGLDEIITAYHNCLDRIIITHHNSLGQSQLFGPSNFATIINHVARLARSRTDGSKYHILLIVTDGIVTDMPLTKEAIVQGSSLPLSIIIVGVGQAQFDAMEELDGDKVRLSSKGRFAERDIVQFVPFRNFQVGLQSTNYRMVRAKLAKRVLAEVPTQFLSYMKLNDIKPGRPRTQVALPPDPEMR